VPAIVAPLREGWGWGGEGGKVEGAAVEVDGHEAQPPEPLHDGRGNGGRGQGRGRRAPPGGGPGGGWGVPRVRAPHTHTHTHTVCGALGLPLAQDSFNNGMV